MLDDRAGCRGVIRLGSMFQAITCAIALAVAVPAARADDIILPARGGEVRCDPAHRARGERVARLLGPLIEEIHDRLGLVVRPAVVVELAADHDELAARAGGEPQPWVAGLAIAEQNRTILRLDTIRPRTRATLAEVLRHEMIHLAFADLENLAPQWFEEGVAQWFAGRVVMGDLDQLSIALKLDQLIPFHELETGFPDDAHSAALAYLESESFVSHMVRLYGEVGLARVLAVMPETGDLKLAVVREWNIALADVELSWKKALAERGSLIGLILRSIPLFAFIGILVVVAYWIKRRSNRTLLDAMDEGGDDAGPDTGDLGRPPTSDPTAP